MVLHSPFKAFHLVIKLDHKQPLKLSKDKLSEMVVCYIYIIYIEVCTSYKLQHKQ